ncbi:hypothetical protein C8J56DRAFT_1054922 [Mycena floridula]|nr:hypothetical protein C8J56DRAFT_1054922 [Mycena floridula]
MTRRFFGRLFKSLCGGPIPITNAKSLQQQHKMYKIYQAREDCILPACLADFRFSKVLDAAAGTCAWAFDFASIPEVKERLRSDASDPLELYACDLTSAKFPSQSVAKSIPLRMFEQDLTKPFEPQFHSTFDLINMRLLVFSLTEHGWMSALRNVWKTLEPGGFLVLAELDTASVQLAPETNATEGISSNRINPWTFYVNRAVSENAKRNGHITNLSKRLNGFVRASGYEVYSQTTITLPIGPLCQTYPGLLGQSVAAAQDLSAEVFPAVFDVLTKMELQSQCLEDENGPVIDEEARQSMSKRYRGFFREMGALIPYTEIVARKPYLASM